MSKKNRRLSGVALGAFLVIGALGITAQAFADDVVGRLSGTALALASGASPDVYLAEVEASLVPPPVALTLADVVALELLAGSDTLAPPAAAAAARVLCEEARRAGIDPLLLVAIMRIESRFNHLAISPAGAEGLMQLMPPTARWMAEREGFAWFEGKSFEPEINLRLGIRYVTYLRERFSSWPAVLTAYNRGPTATRAILRRHGKLPDPIREFYADKVLAHYGKLRRTHAALADAVL